MGERRKAYRAGEGEKKRGGERAKMLTHLDQEKRKRAWRAEKKNHSPFGKGGSKKKRGKRGGTLKKLRVGTCGETGQTRDLKSKKSRNIKVSEGVEV